jgi:hypothetical protein
MQGGNSSYQSKLPVYSRDGAEVQEEWRGGRETDEAEFSEGESHFGGVHEGGNFGRSGKAYCLR